MKTLCATLLLALLPLHGLAQEFVVPPSVRYLSISSSYASMPGIYIDEWGNARIETQCPGAYFTDAKPGKETYLKAIGLLDEMQFRTIPYNPYYKYEKTDHGTVLLESKCEDCTRYQVTLNGGGWGQMHTVQFSQVRNDTYVAKIETLISMVVKDSNVKVCAHDG